MENLNCFFGKFINEFGIPVERDKYSHPYSYDGFITWRGGKNEDANFTVYSDRLLQWDYEKYNKLSLRHFGDEGQVWFGREPAKIEEFLKDWYDDLGLRLIFVMEYCNMASGYPIWRFDIKTK